MNAAAKTLAARVMAYVIQNDGCSIGDIVSACSTNNRVKPIEKAVASLWLAKCIVVRDNIVTLPVGCA